MTESTPAQPTSHSHQDVEQWAQRGLHEALERESPESDAVEQAAARSTSAAGGISPAASTAGASPVEDTSPPGGSPSTPPTDDDPGRASEDGAADDQRGQPGTATSVGNQAEWAGFTGDGAYSGGEFADLNYSSTRHPIQE